MPREFELRKQITLQATPEQVWEAIATGPGIDAWFMGRNEIEPREGGRTAMTIGPSTEEGTVTAWDPLRRFAYQGGYPESGTFMAFEWLIEGRDDGTCVLRLVQSGVLGDDWESEYDALDKGWDMYLHQLAQYLAWFRGRAAAPVLAVVPDGGAFEQILPRLYDGLGLDGPASEGDKVRLTPEGLDPIEGVVDYVTSEALGVRSEDGLYRFVRGPNGMVAVGHHLYADGVDADEAERAWQGWLDRVFETSQ
jgi:uncharacterized protein YndB with AHSA1/START domain